jgi:hypothetical protein
MPPIPPMSPPPPGIGAARIGLDGQPVGVVTADEAEDAARRLADYMAGTAKPPVEAPPQKPWRPEPASVKNAPAAAAGPQIAKRTPWPCRSESRSRIGTCTGAIATCAPLQLLVRTCPLSPPRNCRAIRASDRAFCPLTIRS